MLNHRPLGYVRTPSGDFVIDPDEQVQAVVRLIFEQFGRRGSVNGLLTWLVRHDAKLPVRPHFGPSRGELQWRRPNRATLLNLLHHAIVSRHALLRPVQTYEQLSCYEELLSRIKALRAQRPILAQIAEVLNAEGFRPPKRAARFSAGILTSFLRERGIRTGPLPQSVTQQNHLHPDEWWLADLAARLAMPIATLHRWQRVGWVASRKIAAASGRWAIFADAEELTRLQRLRDSPRGWPAPYPAELTTPKNKPQPTPD